MKDVLRVAIAGCAVLLVGLFLYGLAQSVHVEQSYEAKVFSAAGVR